MFFTPSLFDKLKLLLSFVITGNFSLFLVLFLFVSLVMVEFLMFISFIFFSIIIAYRSKEKRILTTFLLTAAMSFVAGTILSMFMIAVLSANGISLSSTTLLLPAKVFISIMLIGIVLYSIAGIVAYFLAQKAFNKGVNVD